MPQIVQLSAPGAVQLVECEPQLLVPATVRVQTWYSGISAGTELTTYRGSNPYLTQTWDPERRLFTQGAPSTAYPVVGWGYSEVGEVTEVADDVVGVEPGQIVFGAWGHRSDAVVRAEAVIGMQIPPTMVPLHGVFARVGAIALNAVLAAEPHLGERVAIFGQGVIGLLATRLARLSGAEVIAVDGLPYRLALAQVMGATEVVPVNAPGGAGDAIRALTDDVGVDVAIELSGTYRALHEAVRSVGQDGKVVASGFYQGGGEHLRLGEEFHHNRIRIVASQIGGTPVALGARWSQTRLLQVFVAQVAARSVDVAPLISTVLDVSRVADAFELLDQGGAETSQVVLRFAAAPAVPS